MTTPPPIQTESKPAAKFIVTYSGLPVYFFQNLNGRFWDTCDESKAPRFDSRHDAMSKALRHHMTEAYISVNEVNVE
jgi:hypothetical protein